MLLRSLQWAVAWFLLYMGLHILSVRLGRPRLYFVHSVRLFGVLLAAFLGCLVARGGLRGFALLNSAVVFGSLWAFYMEVTFIVMRSVSVRTMVEFARAPTRALAEQELDRLYDTELMFDRRIDSMVTNGYLRQVDGHFGLTGRGAVVANIFRLIRRLLNIQTYG